MTRIFQLVSPHRVRIASGVMKGVEVTVAPSNQVAPCINWIEPFVGGCREHVEVMAEFWVSDVSRDPGT